MKIPSRHLKRQVWFACACILPIAGCTMLKGHDAEYDPELSGKNVVLDVFTARGFLGGSDYERYYLKDDLLLRECGNVASKTQAARRKNGTLEGDNVLGIDPNLIVKQRTIESLNNKELLQIKARLRDLIETISKQKAKGAELPLPGSVFSLASPGVFELKSTLGATDATLLTSVDAIADKESPELNRAHELFSALRAVGPALCGQQTFYGIRRDDSGNQARAVNEMM